MLALCTGKHPRPSPGGGRGRRDQHDRANHRMTNEHSPHAYLPEAAAGGVISGFVQVVRGGSRVVRCGYGVVACRSGMVRGGSGVVRGGSGSVRGGPGRSLTAPAGHP